MIRMYLAEAIKLSAIFATVYMVVMFMAAMK